jgi:hypothetical protein
MTGDSRKRKEVKERNLMEKVGILSFGDRVRNGNKDRVRNDK